MSTHNFFDTGQRSRFPIPGDMFNLNTPGSDNFLVHFKRGAMFFCENQQITLGKLREFFTEKAIELLEYDGYITINKNLNDER